MKIYIDGKFYDKENAKISVFDHGLLYGDGVFEGIRAYNRRVFKLKEHIVRLYESAHSIMLKIPLTQEQMIKALLDTLKVNKLDNAYIRLVVTRGVGDLGLDPRKCKEHGSVIIIADKIALFPEEFYTRGMSIVTVPTVRNMPEMVNPQIKSLNYLNNILAKIEAVNCGYDEAIMMDSMGYVAECTGDNLFIVKKGELYTPPQCMGTLRGITRDAILEISRKNKIPAHEHVITRHEVYISDECFLTGTAAEIMPVVKVDGRVIGKGKPGSFTLRLLKKFQELTAKDGVKY
ncbi:MAG: branched-chain-amino-acid transaminase [Candidatus Omnitrophica bacterium]|jgi:branched-chain amino acid aminotransferase|nr:branched-chain-amino-acid transaminase [Candidatus Omnitrophota bacterium]MDD3274275.1 branched-chain-amino-acid transaminase [Candidatus Omnitrophota bacterium]MDD5077948.1 branched-chain-amino-acid transaminase [Candidatus Omnitrophota bacterium]MDD5725137.1 branched-chain-amino-acid transaminase [Candidatus Omnitrophota bacterium]